MTIDNVNNFLFRNYFSVMIRKKTFSMPISISTKTYWFASLQLLISTWHFNGFKAKKLKIRIVHAIRKFASHNNFQGFSLQKKNRR